MLWSVTGSPCPSCAAPVAVTVTPYVPFGAVLGTVVEIAPLNVCPAVSHGVGTVAVPPLVAIPAAVPAASSAVVIVSVAPAS